MYLLTANRELVVCFERYTQIFGKSNGEWSKHRKKGEVSRSTLFDVFEDEEMAYIALIMYAKNLMEEAHF